MSIIQGTVPMVTFLLVRERDKFTGIEGATNIQWAWARAGGEFNPGTGPIFENGAGWYTLTLPAAATATIGELIIIAKSDDSMDWRNIKNIESAPEPAPEPEGCSCSEIATMIDEAVGGLTMPHVDVDAIIDTVVETLSVESSLSRRTASIPPAPLPEVEAVNLLTSPVTEWDLHCGGEINRTVEGERVILSRQGTAESNCQLFSVQAIEAGRYQMTFKPSATPAMDLGVKLHQHHEPHEAMGLDELIRIDDMQDLVSIGFTVPRGDDAARLRLWLADMEDGGRLEIEDVQLIALGES